MAAPFAVLGPAGRSRVPARNLADSVLARRGRPAAFRVRLSPDERTQRCTSPSHAGRGLLRAPDQPGDPLPAGVTAVRLGQGGTIRVPVSEVRRIAGGKARD